MVSEDVVEARSRQLGLQHGNSVDQTVFLSKGRACHGVQPNEDVPGQRRQRLGCRRWQEVGRTVLTDTVKCRDCYFKLYSLWHWEPMKHVAKSRRDVFVFANSNDQTGSSVQNRLIICSLSDDRWKNIIKFCRGLSYGHNAVKRSNGSR